MSAAEGTPVRWDELFRDLEAQLDVADAVELAAEVADRSRREAAELTLVDRLLPTVGHPVRLHVQGPGHVAGRLEHLSVDSLLVREASAREALVPLSAVLTVQGVTPWSVGPASQRQVFQRLRLPSAVRGLARDRSCVQVVLRDGTAFTGTVDRVGREFFELAEHASGEPRRREQITGARVIALAAVGVFFSC